MMLLLAAAALLFPTTTAILRVSSQIFNINDDLDGKCEELYGPGWVQADWTDITSKYNGASLSAALAYAWDDGSSVVPLYGSAYVLNNGMALHHPQQLSNRRYYIMRYNYEGTEYATPNQFISLDSMSNSTPGLLHLAAWSGNRRIMCDGPADMDCADSHAWVVAAPTICHAATADSCACQDLCMTLHSGWQYDEATQECCCWA